MAATESDPRAPGAVLAAALALPGLMLAAPAAQAESAPEQGIVSLRHLWYGDSQPGFDRVHVRSPSLYVLAPIGSRWSLEASLVSDSVSGASPRYHTAISGASRMDDQRHAGDVKITRYEDRGAYAVGVASSDEHDFHSRAVSLETRFSSEDNNRTWTVALGYTHDRIGSVNDSALDAGRYTSELLLGLTQALSTTDLVQINLSASRGRGYYSDPYKDPDVRPRARDTRVLLGRWNHHVESWDATLRASYRYTTDSFGIDSHTLQAEWVQPAGAMFTLTPSLRLYTQSAADFYFDPVYDPDVGAPYPPGYFTNPPAYISPDQRLSAFGAVTLGLKLGMALAGGWSGDVKFERYEQRSQWRVGGSGSPGLEPFRANIFQVGLSKKF